MHLPTDESRIIGKLDACPGMGPCTREQNILLGEPFERSAGGDPEALLDSRGGACTAVELGCSRRGDQHRSTHSDVQRDLDPVATHQAPRRVQQIELANIPLRVKGALDREWSDLAFMGQDCSSGPYLEPQIESA